MSYLLNLTPAPERTPLQQRCFDSVLKECSDMNIVQWSEADKVHMIQSCYPDLFDAYTRLPYDVLRWDIARLLILHYTPGYYLDSDVCLHQSLSRLNIVDGPVFAAGHPDDCKRVLGGGPLLETAFIKSTNLSREFFLDLARTALTRFDTAGDTVFGKKVEGVLAFAGPTALTVHWRRREYPGVVLDHTSFYPESMQSWHKARAAYRAGKSYLTRCGIYGTHQFEASWSSQVGWVPQ